MQNEWNDFLMNRLMYQRNQPNRNGEIFGKANVSLFDFPKVECRVLGSVLHMLHLASIRISTSSEIALPFMTRALHCFLFASPIKCPTKILNVTNLLNMLATVRIKAIFSPNCSVQALLEAQKQLDCFSGLPRFLLNYKFFMEK